jgi:hypothetical protein
MHARDVRTQRIPPVLERLDSSCGTPVLPRKEVERPACSYLQVLSLDLEQTAAKRDRHRMRSILCLELGDEILDVEVDRRLGNG